MPFNVSEFGGLAVAFNPADKREVQRALSRLDPELFLDQEVEPNGPRGPFVYFVVKHWIGSGHPPIPVLEWRDWDGPRPLSMAIVEHVRRREGAMEGAFKSVLENNARKVQEAKDATGEGVEEIARGGFKSAKGAKSVLLPRSQSLRQSRDRARAKGHKV